MKKTALVTGASSGIGLELAKIHASKGDNLIITARREDELNKIKEQLENDFKVNVRVIPSDLSTNGSVIKLFEKIKNDGIEIDYLINNAGFGGYGKFHERDWNRDEQMINLNIKALTELTRLFLPLMIKRNSGKIMNVASTAGFIPGPLMAVYFASKAYVVSLTQAISEELSGTKVTITALCPGPVDTGFVAAGDLEGSNLFKRAKTAKEVALIGYKAMMKGKLIKINEVGLRFALRWIIPFMPRKLVLKISRKTMEKSAA